MYVFGGGGRCLNVGDDETHVFFLTILQPADYVVSTTKNKNNGYLRLGIGGLSFYEWNGIGTEERARPYGVRITFNSMARKFKQG